LIYRATLWFLRQPRLLSDIGAAVARFSGGERAVAAGVHAWLGERERSALEGRAAALVKMGVPAELARRSAALDASYSALDIVSVGDETRRPVETVAAVYFGVSSRLDLPWLRGQIGRLPTDTHWQVRARAALRDDLAVLQRQIGVSVLSLGPGISSPGELIAAWEAQAGSGLERARQAIAELQGGGAPDLSMLSVALRELRALV